MITSNEDESKEALATMDERKEFVSKEAREDTYTSENRELKAGDVVQLKCCDKLGLKMCIEEMKYNVDNDEIATCTWVNKHNDEYGNSTYEIKKDYIHTKGLKLYKE